MWPTCQKAASDPEPGAPKGNLNRLATSVRSKQIQEAIARALRDPQGRTEVHELVRRWGSKSAV